MKNILKIITLIVAVLFVTVSCDYEDSNWDMLTKEVDANATYFVQFKKASKSLQTGVSLTGGLVEIVTPIEVALLGTPLSTPLEINLAIDPSTTIGTNMYTLSSSKITIPAGATSGSITLTTIAANMPVGVPLKFVLNISQGDHNATAGTQLTYTLKRIEFCPLVNGSADLAGTWSNTKDLNSGSTANPAWYTEDGFSAVANGEKLDISGISESFIAGFWGEPVVAGGTFTMEISGNGFVTIPRQYIYTTTYNGSEYDYEIKGSGTWTNCGAKPTLTFTYDIYYVGDADGLAKTYKSYLKGPTLGGTWTLN